MSGFTVASVFASPIGGATFLAVRLQRCLSVELRLGQANRSRLLQCEFARVVVRGVFTRIRRSVDEKCTLLDEKCTYDDLDEKFR